MPLPSEVGSLAQEAYDAFKPVANADPQYNYPLLSFLASILDPMYQIVADIVFDQGDDPGWSQALDLDRCPEVALPWLGQFVGVRIPGYVINAGEQAMRDYIRDTPMWMRGTPAAMIGAAKATLTGQKRLMFYERDGDPYWLTVRSYTSETPDVNATRAALISQKPAGILMDYRMVDGQTYLQLRSRFASYSAVKTNYDSYFAVKTDEPPLVRAQHQWLAQEEEEA